MVTEAGVCPFQKEKRIIISSPIYKRHLRDHTHSYKFWKYSVRENYDH